MGEHIPNFKDRDEEARFWQKTGLDQLSPDEYEESQVERPQGPLSATFAVRFDPKTVELIRSVARDQGLGATQLVRAWVLERLMIERAVGALAKPTSSFPHDFELAIRRTIVGSLFRRIPSAAEEAMQQVFERVDQEGADFLESIS
jgi:hypothetical protein